MANNDAIECHKKWQRLIQIFSGKLILEVFGGCGAIWGFSEALGLRNDNTVWFWRPCSLGFGVIFFLRWFIQISDYMNQSTYTDTPNRRRYNTV